MKTRRFFAACVLLAFSIAAHAAEMFGAVGDGNWRRCAGSACWDQSGDPNFPLPVAWKTRGNTFQVGVRAWEIEASLAYLGPGKSIVVGRFVNDANFDEHRRRVRGCPEVIDATVDQWTAGARLVWAPRWRLTSGLSVQPELGAFVHKTRWAITWTSPHPARGDGGGWGVTPTGGLRAIFDAPRGMAVDVALQIYHKPTVLHAPLGGGGNDGPGLVVTTVGLRY